MVASSTPWFETWRNHNLKLNQAIKPVIPLERQAFLYSGSINRCSTLDDDTIIGHTAIWRAFGERYHLMAWCCIVDGRWFTFLRKQREQGMS